ncbi:MAG: thiouridylase [Chlamydiae bacterium SM23_39]|nr:MAG: thiouridylase [Chlamydiae bacterium SM23_39]
MAKIIVGMSGGVDSSVSSFLLKKMGYDVIAIFIKCWDECNFRKDYEDALLVCEQLKIPLYKIDFTEEYKERVFKNFLEEYKKGNTPNPDILCNKEIKFNLFLQKAEKLNADFIATGHYAQKRGNCLMKARDLSKDQTYFLYTLKSDILKKVVFPIGHLKKEEVRKIAKESGLITSEKKDSTGICFIGKRDFRPFLKKYIACKKGAIENLDGKIVGEHEGVFLYTIGQRKGLGIGGEGEAWFVVEKDVKNNVLIVAQGENHPALMYDSIVVSSLTWIPSKMPFFCKAKIRYRQKDQDCIIEKIEEGNAFIRFMTLQRAPTAGQSVVFYRGEHCLGGGIIIKTGKSLYFKELTAIKNIRLY